MMLVTYLPRLVPFLLLKEDKLPPQVRRFLDLLPVCALGALLVPDIIYAVPDRPLAALGGCAAAALVASLKGGMTLSVLCGVAGTYLLLLLPG